jgi:uncharacterized phiE125 gp8 family phage protein
MGLQRTIQAAALALDVLELRAQVRQDVTTDDAMLQLYLRGATLFAEERCGRTIVASRWKFTIDAFPGPTLMGVPFGRPFNVPGSAILLERGPVLTVQSIKYVDMNGTQQTLSPSSYVVDTTQLPARITPVFGQIWPPTLPQINAVEVIYDAGEIAPLTFTASSSTIGIKGGIWQALNVGDNLRFQNSGGTLPAPLAADTDYYVASVLTPTTFTVSATLGGSAVTMTDVGTGTHYIGRMHDSVRTWLLTRVGAFFENREDTLILQRGTVVEIPYTDRLLDGATVYLN